MFNTVLKEAGLSPQEVRLLRHQDKKACKPPYQLWRDEPRTFEIYQSHQLSIARNYFASPYWASFVGTSENDTLFVGLYAVGDMNPLEHDSTLGHAAGLYDHYILTICDELREFAGRLYIDWVPGTKLGDN